jgi:hypothetical protein
VKNKANNLKPLEINTGMNIDQNKVDKKWYSVFTKKKLFLLSFLPLSLILLWGAKNNSKFAEYVFARGIYKWISQGLSFITGRVPISLMEIEIIGALILGILLVLRFGWRLVHNIRKKQKDTSYMFANGFLNVACTLSVILFLFLIFGGLNYYRYPFATYSGLDIKESSVDELYSLCLQLAEEAAEIRTELGTQTGTEDENGILLINESGWKDVSKTAEEAFNNLSEEYPILGGNYGLPKPVVFSRFMSRMEITGIFWPFTMEANVDIDTTEYSIPVTMCHELAHLRGFMREDEANFIAYLACKQSDSLEFQYSGIMLALSYAGNQLYKQDATLYKQVQEKYSTGMMADLREEYYYWKQFEDTVISTVSNTMNDNYLKANSQDDGVKSYGRMVDLLLAEYRKNK